ncbi:helix-turn-helix domain-containing protein [Halalkalibaculum sp. DA3122]|uniref:AraC family transcriptional regulator n=1 Tax=Halalkalibaculum sp. DA3122 TaxID=3373607 RepID=UPI003754840D
MSIHITEYRPIEYLQPYVELFWKGDFNVTRMAEFRQQVVPNGFLELIIHLSEQHCDLPYDGNWSKSPDYTIIGLYTKPYEVRFCELVNTFGIRFKPEGIYNLFGVPASLFSESYDDMEQVLGPSFREYCSKMMEASNCDEMLKLTEKYLLNQLERNTSELTYVNYAAEMIRKSEDFNKIEEIPGKVYVSLRQLEREFKNKIGTTPKRYMRIARLNEVHKKLESNQELELTQVAFDCGYADQAHFIRDFKSIMGVNPTLFIKKRDQFIVNHPT